MAAINSNDTKVTTPVTGVVTVNPGGTITNGVQYYSSGGQTYANSNYQAPAATAGYVTNPSTGQVYTSPAVAASYGINNTVPSASYGQSQPQPVPPPPAPVAPVNPVNPVNPNPNNSAIVGNNLATAFNAVKDTTAPQSAGDAASAITTATNTAAQTPTFYKPDPNSQQVYNAQNQAVSHDQFIAQGGKADFSNVTNGPVPVKPLTPVSPIDQTLAADKGYQQLQKDYTDYQNVANQGKSLLDTYNQIVQSSGLDSINTQLINTQKVINGTEEDIRNEVTAAGGFASNSQVLALADSRNKTLVQNYNALVAQQKNVTDQINNMMTLSESDRNYALQTAQNKINIDGQMLDYQQKFTQAAQEAYTNTIAVVGYNGLLQSLGNDTNAINLAEKTLGLQPGQLKSIAAQQQVQTDQQNQMNALDLKAKEASINASNASAASSSASAAKSRADLAFEQAHGGMTQAEVQTQTDAANKRGQDLLDAAAKNVADLDARKITWGAAWNSLHTQFPEADTATLDNVLNASLYRNSQHGG